MRTMKACAIAVALALVASACGDKDTSGGGSTSSTTSTSSSSSSTGSSSTGSSSSGAGGAGGGGVGGAGGAGGQAPVTCLAAAASAAYFAIEDAGFCVVAMHTADVVLGYDMATSFMRAPSWGRQGGPLTLTPGATGSVDVVRWSVPADPMGALTSQTTNVAAMIPASSFLGSQAIDLPFFGWTAIGYTGAYPATQGKALLLSGAAIDASYDVNGFYAAAGVAAMSGQGRLLYTGLSALSDAAKNVNALYAADSCGAVGMSPRLVPSGDASCGAPIEIAAWNDASGPVLVDGQGDVFAEMSTLNGTQELRGFAAKTVARGAGPTAGDVMMDIAGFGSSLAALAPVANVSGVLAFQPNDAATYAALDVVEQRFTVVADKLVPVSPVATPNTMLKLTTAGTALALMTDDAERIWVGAPNPGGGTMFLVLARKP